MSSNVQAIGTTPSTYRLISPTVTVDASGGTVEVDGNSKFNTNIPFDYFALITQLTWYVAIRKSQVFNAVNVDNIWQYQAQLSEALARTKVALNDPVPVDTYFDEFGDEILVTSAVGEPVIEMNRPKAQWIHVLANPWATAAQQLNLVASIIPATAAVSAGPKIDHTVVIEYNLLRQTPEIRSYLAQRIQIAGQA